MPTPDASQFTQMKKFKAIQGRGLVDKSVRSITHLYQPVPSTSGLTDFLPSFSNKNVSPVKFTLTHLNLPRKAKVGGVTPGCSYTTN